MDGLLRKKDLVEAVGVAKSTIVDWIVDFNVYIPVVKHGAVTSYRPETVDVLKTIRELREKDHSKVQIMELLAQKGFPITAEEAIDDVKRVLSGTDPRDTLLTVIQKMGQAGAEIGKQDGRINRVKSVVLEYSKQMDGQDGRITETADQVVELQKTVEELKQQLSEAQRQIAATKEQANKPWWKRWK